MYRFEYRRLSGLVVADQNIQTVIEFQTEFALVTFEIPDGNFVDPDHAKLINDRALA